MFLKLKREDFSAGEIAIGSIIHDTLAPFLGVKSFVKLLLQKYLDSPNEPHANIFLAQGITSDHTVVSGACGCRLCLPR